MIINPLCRIAFYCAPLLNILCSTNNIYYDMKPTNHNIFNYNTSNYHTSNYNTSNYIYGTNITTSYTSTNAFEYHTYDYSNNTFIFEKWFGRKNIEGILWNMDNFALLMFKWIYEKSKLIYETPIYYEMQYNANHILMFAMQCVMNLINYAFIYGILYLVSGKFKLLRTDFKMYVISNISKATILTYLVIYFSPFLKTIIIDDWPDIFWKNCSMLYASTDFISLFLVSRNKLSTIIHHICTVTSCLLFVTIGHSDNYLWKALMLYGMFSSLACGANAFLGIRFLTSKKSASMIIFNYIVAVSYILCCIFNWSIQVYYLLYCIPLSIASIMYMTCIYFFIRDDIILIKFQLMYYFNINKIKEN